jgi:ABC-type lipoprotein export system ATPase subunit
MDASYLQNSGPVELHADEPLQQPSRVDAKTTASGNNTMLRKKIFIAVMGVTGAGKSTFIKAASGLDNVLVGHDLTSCKASMTWVTCMFCSLL